MIRAALLCSLLLSTSALAAETFRYNTRGNGAEAGFGTSDDCQSTSAWLYVVESTDRAGRDSWGGQWGSLNFGGWNWCTGESTWGWADLSGLTFTSSGSRGATLKGTATAMQEEFLGCEWVEHETPICFEDEFGGESFCEEGFWDCRWTVIEKPVVVDLAWQPTDTSRGVTSQSSMGQGYVAHWRSVGSTGYGPVSGVLDIDGLSFAGESSWGSSWSSTSGSVFVQRTNR